MTLPIDDIALFAGSWLLAILGFGVWIDNWPHIFRFRYGHRACGVSWTGLGLGLIALYNVAVSLQFYELGIAYMGIAGGIFLLFGMVLTLTHSSLQPRIRVTTYLAVITFSCIAATLLAFGVR